MKSLDTQARQAEREGLGLKARLRAGLLEVAYSCAQGVACGFCMASSGFVRAGEGEIATCPRCEAKGRAPADPEDLLRLLAFCGVEEARALVPATLADGGLFLDDWIRLLSRHAAKLPARRVEVDCRQCGLRGPSLGRVRCPNCKSTGKVHHDTPASQWLLTAAALAVGRACFEQEFSLINAGGFAGRSYQALDAGDAWVEEPTQERWRQWELAVAPWQPTGRPAWVICEAIFDGRVPTDALLAAAEVLGKARVREIVCAEVVRRVLG